MKLFDVVKEWRLLSPSTMIVMESLLLTGGLLSFSTIQCCEWVKAPVSINYDCDPKSASYSRSYWLLKYLIVLSGVHEGRLPIPCGSTMIVIKLLTGVWWPCGLLNYLMRWSAVNEYRLLGEILLLCGGLVAFSINLFCIPLWIRECTCVSTFNWL